MSVGREGCRPWVLTHSQHVPHAAAPGCSQGWQCFGGLSWLFLSCLSRCPVWHFSHNDYAITSVAFGIKISFKLEWLGRDGSAGGKGKAPVLHPLDIWRPCAGKQPRCVSEELYLGSTWVNPAEKKQLLFNKTFFHPSTNMFQHSGELTAMSDIDAAERPPHKTVLYTFS